MGCSSLDLPSLFTMHVSSSSRGTFASGSRLLTFPASLCASTPRSTLTSASSLPSEVADQAASRGRTPRRVMTRVPTPTSKVSFEHFGNKSSGSEQDNVKKKKKKKKKKYSALIPS